MHSWEAGRVACWCSACFLPLAQSVGPYPPHQSQSASSLFTFRKHRSIQRCVPIVTLYPTKLVVRIKGSRYQLAVVVVLKGLMPGGQSVGKESRKMGAWLCSHVSCSVGGRRRRTSLCTYCKGKAVEKPSHKRKA